MKKKTLPSVSLKCCIIFFLGIFTLSPVNSFAQLIKNFATISVGHSSGGSGTINVPDFLLASDQLESTFATLNAQSLLLFNNSSFVEIGFPSSVPQGSMVYIPVEDDPATGIFTTLVGGTLGNLVTSLISNKFIEVNVKNSLGNTLVSCLSNSSQRTFPQGTFNFVIGPTGQKYITFKASPGVDYSRIQIVAKTGGILGTSYQIKVQAAYYLSGNYDACNPFVTTSFDASGLTLSVLNSNGDPVKNPERAIDSDSTNFSTFGYGLVNASVGSTYSQDFYFSNLSKPGDQVKLKFRFPVGLLAIGVLNNIKVNAYRNDTLLSTANLSSLISAEALSLLTINLASNIPAVVQLNVDNTTGQTLQFDRIRLSYTQLANTAVSQFMEVYGLDRVPALPIVIPPAGNCPGTSMHLSIANIIPGVIYKWFNSSGILVSNDSFYNITVPPNGVTETYSIVGSGCNGIETIVSKVSVTGNTATCTGFSPIVFLQNAFNGTRNKDVTPAWAAILANNATSQPYNTPMFQYNGTESVSPAAFTSTLATDDILDWVLLELKDSAGSIVDRRAALLLENGKVTNLDKTQPVLMTANPGKYYLTVRHRNHLGLSTNLLSYLSGSNLFNFSVATDPDLFGNISAYITVNGYTLLRGGNANSNVNTRFNGAANDRDAILSALGGNGATNLFDVYSPADINLDGIIRYNGSNNDRDVLLLDLGGNGSTTIFQQIR